MLLRAVTANSGNTTLILASPMEVHMDSRQSPRRRFLKHAAALAGLTVGAVRSAVGQSLSPERSELRLKELHAYGGRSGFVNSARTGSLGIWPPAAGPTRDFGFRTPLQDSVGMITPAALHFVLSHGYEPLDIDPRQHRLMIHGLVDRPLVFTLDELERLPSVSRFHFLECHGNSATSGPTGALRMAQTATVQETHGLTSCSEWTGVPLSVLLREVGVQKGASWFVAEGADAIKHTKSIPLDKAMDDILVAYGQNGEPLRPEQGYPLRLVVPGWQGINNVKWLRRIKVVDQPYMSMMETTRYPSLRPDGKSRWFESEMGPKSVITRPSGGQRLPSPGFYEITGLAWSGGGAIRRVEVSTDGGRIWKDAQLQEPLARKAHTRFVFAWNWDGEDSVLQSRCTDERGQLQPAIAEIAKIWNVDLDYFRLPSNSTVDMGNFNAIQPWKVARDGSVHNALV
jgi:sulfane dehydrogenase subunit SoxC